MKLLLSLSIVFFCGLSHADFVPLKLDWEYTYSSSVERIPLFPKKSNNLTRIKVGDLVFRSRIYGMNNNGDALVLLHGFPGSSIMWEPLALEASRKGYRVLAFDLRGYSPGARPLGADKYRVDYYIDDLLKITHQIGFKQFHLLGHDIGCVIAWGTAMIRPKKLKTLNCLSIPNPDVLDLRNYIRLFSIPLLPEAALRFNGSQQFLKLFPYNRSQSEDSEYRSIFSEPGSLTAALNFYRSIYKSQAILREHYSSPIDVPTLFLYGKNEGWVQAEVLERQALRMKSGVELRVVEINNAGPTGHFLIESQPDRVIREVMDHISP